TAYDQPGATGSIIIGIRNGTQWTSRTRFADVTDGLSNTVFIGEKHIQLGQLRRVKGDRTIWNGDSADVFSRIGGPGKGLVGNLNTATNQRFGSWHPGVCQFVFGDGGVRALPVTIPEATISLLIQRSDGQVIPSWERSGASQSRRETNGRLPPERWGRSAPKPLGRP